MRPGPHKRIDEREFLEKFMPKRTSDDCFTPPNIYDIVREWAFARYALAPDTPVLRPFWPGKDYTALEYPAGSVVIDNPPFSILAAIIRFYLERGVRFFLFAPYLSNFSEGRGDPRICHVIAPRTVRWENGAEVPVSFVTNLDAELVAESAPDLCARITEADKENRKRAKVAKQAAKRIKWPSAVLTSAGLGYLAVHGVPFRVKKEDAAFLRTAGEEKKDIFGGGFLLSERAAAERAAAERAAAENAIELTEQEKALQRTLGRKDFSTAASPPDETANTKQNTKNTK